MANLIKTQKGTLQVKEDSKRVMYVGELEQKLLKKYPAADAIPGDKTGLLVGDPVARIERVAVALDPTVSAIRAAKLAGANVLLTHHPSYREGVVDFKPSNCVGQTSGSIVFDAIKANIALMNFHTALDVSADAQRVLPSLLHLAPLKGTRKVNGVKVKNKVLQPIPGSKDKGFGQVCEIKETSLSELGSRCTAVFGRSPRVWGDLRKKCKRVVTATGSAGSLISLCLKTGVDVLIAGEVKYHDALTARESGLCIIDLGHDVSELPLAAVLANSCKKIGLESSRIVILDQGHNWEQIRSITI